VALVPDTAFSSDMPYSELPVHRHRVGKTDPFRLLCMKYCDALKYGRFGYLVAGSRLSRKTVVPASIDKQLN